MTQQCRYFWNIWSGVALHHMKVEPIASKPDANGKLPLVFVVIPGNPGCIQFYEKFAETLCYASSVSVWGVSHTGHAQAQKGDGVSHPSVVECGLDKQIQHKIDYLQMEVLPKCQNVILIGHSIGCYIILQIFHRMQKDARYHSIRKGILLFPTIERMKETPQGLRLTPLVSNARWIFTFVVGILRFLPPSVIHWLSGFVTKSKEECIRQTIANHLTVSVTDCCTYMGLQEMYEVSKRNDDIISANISKLIFYYGGADGWCPTSYYEDCLSVHGHHPRSDIKLCTVGYDHAFVIKSSSEVAKLVAEWTANVQDKCIAHCE